MSVVQCTSRRTAIIHSPQVSFRPETLQILSLVLPSASGLTQSYNTFPKHFCAPDTSQMVVDIYLCPWSKPHQLWDSNTLPPQVSTIPGALQTISLGSISVRFNTVV